MPDTLVNDIDSGAMRFAGRELLSVALMDARNHSLHLGAQIAAHQALMRPAAALVPERDPPLWELGHIGWFQEWWLARNVMRTRGAACDARAIRLPSIESGADMWWDDTLVPPAQRWRMALPNLGRVQTYLLDTLETTLELLDKAPDDDAGLYFYRLALAHEDLHGESLIVGAQLFGVPLELALPGPGAVRAPLCVPATRWTMGRADEHGFSFDNQRPAHAIDVPEFEIDAQPITWAQFVEFVDDGGYDRAELWQTPGWQWLQDKAASEVSDVSARGPRYVQQIGVASGAVMQTRFGTPRRMLGSQSAMHLSWWEADAWCRWAGRRLPAEVEWELAAHTAARRGFRWGDVWEWTGTSARGYPGFKADPWRAYSEACFGSHKVLRGASFATRERMKSARFRYFEPPGCDQVFVGFRSCAL